MTLHKLYSTSIRPLSLMAVIVLLILAATPTRTSAAVYPNSIASMGDSITRGFNTGPNIYADAPENSWSTGTNTTVNSIYRRILAVNPAISGRNYNAGRTGAKMVDLVGQANTTNGYQVEYATILLGANDVCTSSEANMTSVTTFRAQFQAGLQTLANGSPNTRIYVVSIPNIYTLWSVLKDNPTARTVWGLGICQSMLANPASTAQADVDRRARVRQRNIDFNTQLREVCAQFPQCRFDNNAVFNTTFVASDVSVRDFFHPVISGQMKLARAAWSASEFQ